MNPPFSAEQFFQVFTEYNTAVWPAQIPLLLLAVAATALSFLRQDWTEKAIASILGFFWVWMGAVYHWAFFATINPSARVFGALFLLEGGLLLWFGFRRAGPRFEPKADLFGIAGGFLILYGLLFYPLLGALVGHRYPAQPTFGLPCPTTIFTMGVLLWARPPVPWAVLLVPAAWAVVGMSAVLFFGVVEDVMLPVAGILGGAMILWKNRRQHRSAVIL